MSEFKELRRGDFEKFLEAFSKPGTLKYRNNRWVGLNRKGEPFTVHVKHGSTRKYSRRLIEAIAGDLGVSREEFTHNKKICLYLAYLLELILSGLPAVIVTVCKRGIFMPYSAQPRPPI